MGRRFTNRAALCRPCGAGVFPLWGPMIPVIKGSTQNPWITWCALGLVRGRSGSRFQGAFSWSIRLREFRLLACPRPLERNHCQAFRYLGAISGWRWKRSSRLETRAKEFRYGASPRACTNPKGGVKAATCSGRQAWSWSLPGLGMTDPATRSRPHARGSEMEHHI
jgi:hypothetical protein